MPRTVATTLVLAVLGAGVASAQPANPFFLPQPPAARVEPPAGPIIPYFGTVSPAAVAQRAPVPAPANPFFTGSAVASPAMPVDYGTPYFGNSPTATQTALSLCEPAHLDTCFQSCGPAPGLCDPCSPGGACSTPDSCDENAKKHPVLNKLRTTLPPEPTWWFSSEYLLWHISGDRVIAPLAASANTGSIAALVADPRSNATAVNFVQRYGAASGGRFSGGWWSEEECCVRTGFEWSAFMLERRADGVTFSSDAAGSPIILRPFIDIRSGQPAVAIVSFPGAERGNLSVNSSTYVWGGEANAVRRVFLNEGGVYWDTLAGLRYIDLDENFAVTQNTGLLANGVAGFGGTLIRSPNGLQIIDAIDTRSHFFGGQLGTRVGVRRHRFTGEGYVKVALGWSHESANLYGSTTLTGPGANGGQSLPGGFLNVPTNSGHRSADDFAVVPEVGLKVGYDLTRWLRLTAGYSALYWSSVARPGTQVGSFVNPVQVPSSLLYGQPVADPVPSAALGTHNLWISGVNFGAVFKY
jgi:hypothetical protein